MKRELIQNVKVQPYTSGDALNREGYLSGVLGVSLGAASGSPTAISLKVSVTECDTEAGSYTAVKDKNVFVDQTAAADGSITIPANKAGNELHNIDLDLVGCKPFVKITVTANCSGGSSPSCAATCAIALGDTREQPEKSTAAPVGE